MKRIFIVLIIVITITGIFILKHRYDNEKYTDVNYAASHYITTGLFNKNKLFKISDLKLNFSDGRMAVVTVTGQLYKVPHNVVKFDIIMEKNDKGIWKVAKVYN